MMIFFCCCLLLFIFFSFVFGPWSLNDDVFHLCLIIAPLRLVIAALSNYCLKSCFRFIAHMVEVENSWWYWFMVDDMFSKVD
jgi:hypothetical protein